MKKNKARPAPGKSRYQINRAGDMYFLKIVIKWLGFAVLLLIVGLLVYLLIPH
ncbi:MAG: hypothetical protein WC399_01960 [Bacilli bacterium]